MTVKTASFVSPTRNSRWRPIRIGRLDRYLVRRALPSMTAVLTATTVAFLFERLLRSFDLLARSSGGGHFLFELAVNLVPHYVGLTLPIGFFVGLFVVVNRLNADSEIDAMLASGVSLDRIAAPFCHARCGVDDLQRTPLRLRAAVHALRLSDGAPCRAERGLEW